MGLTVAASARKHVLVVVSYTAAGAGAAGGGVE